MKLLLDTHVFRLPTFDCRDGARWTCERACDVISSFAIENAASTFSSAPAT